MHDSPGRKPLCLALAIVLTLVTTVAIDQLAAANAAASPFAGAAYPAAAVLA